jgi:hypothetical protein
MLVRVTDAGARAAQKTRRGGNRKKTPTPRPIRPATSVIADKVQLVRRVQLAGAPWRCSATFCLRRSISCAGVSLLRISLNWVR